MVLQGCRLLKLCLNLPARHCVAGVQAVKVVSEPTCQALCCRGAGCLIGVRTYLPGTVLQGCRLVNLCLNLPAGYCVACCRLFKRCWNRPAGLCGAGVQAVQAVLEPTSHALWGRGAGCFSGVGTYLPALCCRSAGCLSGVGTFPPGTVLQVACC